VALARALLERGADPNAYFANEFGPMSVLYGAAGVLHNAELTTLLLDHGANPNGEPCFGDALYHSTEAKDPACLKTMLAHGARPQGSHALGHALDYDRPEHVRLLLEAGDDPKEVLVHAVRRGRDLDCIRLLVEHGAALDHRGGEWSTPEEQYRTAYQNAVLRGRDDVVAFLAQQGASTNVAPEDLVVAAVARGERPDTPLPPQLDHDAQEVLIVAALDDKLDLVVDLLGPNYFGHVGGGPPGTLLHHASWVGKPHLVGRLLERGADPVALSGAEFDKPIAWAALGSRWHRAPGRDYVAVVELLVAAGAEVEPRFVEVAQGPLAGWLQDRL
jgi:ankyrin repeat protein